jgi:hypothetical protein
MMLQLRVRSALIVPLIDRLRMDGTLRSLAIAKDIRDVRLFFENGARRFAERQQHARGKRLELVSGRSAVLEAALFSTSARMPWPNRAAAVLHGLRLADMRPMSGAVAVRDPYSYLAPLQIGPDSARAFGDYVAIAAYFDPLLTMDIIWIGREREIDAGWTWIYHETDGLGDWSALNPDYAAWLAAPP